MTSARVSTPHRVGDLLVAAVPALAERMLAVEISRQWEALVGPALARRSRPGALERGILEIRADNSPCLMELEMRGGEILEAITRRHGRSVLSLRFVLGAMPTIASRSRRAAITAEKDMP
jgi:predicted nucleic acid-binding Zn ribbon protein